MASSRFTEGDSLETWVYLVNWVLAVILGLAFVFYFARLVAYVITFLLRTFIWKKFRVSVSVGSFRISPLGGRITARTIVISTADYTISLLRFNFTWRYWLLPMTKLSQYYVPAADGPAEEPTGPTAAVNRKLPASFQLLIDGLEIFMYNRNVAFDNLMEALSKEENSDNGDSFKLYRSSGSSDSFEYSLNAQQAEKPGLRFLLLFLPVQINIKRGAFVLGNHTTPSVLVASFRTAKGLLDLCQPPSKLDICRAQIDLIMERFQVSLKPNILFDPNRYSQNKEPGSSTSPNVKAKAPRNKRSIFTVISKILPRKLRPSLRRPFDYLHWEGLRRYAEEFDSNKVVDFADIEEYAKYSLILDSVSTRLIYFYDVPGYYPTKDFSTEATDPSPEFGVDLTLSTATVHYGSWADRQRGPLQTLLFPVLARDSEASPPFKKAGQLRRYEGFALRIHTDDEIIFRIPTREFSKDKEEISHSGDADANQQKNSRPFGWIELKCGPESSIGSFTSYISTAEGWPNKLTVKLKNLEVRSSVTHDILLTALEHQMNCSIGFPLKWNGKCRWSFEMHSTNGSFFFLREHVTLFTDLVSDFGSGPPVPYESSRPFDYNIDWKVSKFKLYFNVNDHNIINDPLDFDSNKYLCFEGDELNLAVLIPLNGGFSPSTTVKYKLSTPHLKLFLEVPSWHTVSAFMEESKQMGSSDQFEIAGAYTYHNKIEVNQNNLATINAIGDNVSLLFYGYLIRYLFTFRENYFGDYTKFKTFEEYSLTHADLEAENSPVNSSTDQVQTESRDPDFWKILKIENDLNVIFTFRARKGMIVLPCRIYDHKHHISLVFDYLDVDIHICNFYMDLQADFSTAEGFHMKPKVIPSGEIVFDMEQYGAAVAARHPDVLIDGFSIHTHRMLSIDNLTYQCKWDFACNSIMFDSDPLILTALTSIIGNFIMGFKDLENTLVYKIPTVYDAANFSFRCPEIVLRLETGFSRIYLEVILLELLVNFNDIANYRYSSKVSMSLPEIIMRVVDENFGLQSLLYLKTSLLITNICQKAKMLEHRLLQQDHVRRNDASTHRTSFLLFPENKDKIYLEALGSMYPTTSLPGASHPLTEEFLMCHKMSNRSSSSVSSSSSDTSYDESMEGSSEMNPTTTYYDEDFMPRSKPTPGFKTDSLIYEIDKVDFFMCPFGMQALLEVFFVKEQYEPDFLLDKLHSETVFYLQHLIFPSKLIDNFRIVCPHIDIKCASEGMEDPERLFSSPSPIPILGIVIAEPSIALSKKTSSKRDGFILNSKSTFSLALHVKSIYASISLPKVFCSTLSCEITELEGWLHENENGQKDASLSINSIFSALEDSHTSETFDFIRLLIRQSQDLGQVISRASQSSKMWRRDLIHSLCDFAVKNNVESDPRVLTKPARILRSSKDHVRFYEAWKVMTKLRSIYKKASFSDSQNQRFFTYERAPDDALDLVLNSFRQWRSWEGNMVERKHYFRTIFSDEKQMSSTPCLLVKIANVHIRLEAKKVNSDYLTIHNVELCVDSLKDSKPLEFNSEVDDQAKNVLVSAGSCDLSISPLVLSTAKKLNEVLGSQSRKTEATGQDSTLEKPSFNTQAASNVGFLLNIGVLHARFDILNTFFEVYFHNLALAAQARLALDELSALSIATSVKEMGLNFGSKDTIFIDCSFGNPQLTLVLLNNSGKAVLVDVNVNSAEFHLHNQEDAFCLSMKEFMRTELPELKALVSSEQVELESREDSADFNLPSLMVNFQIRHCSLTCEFLMPVIFKLKLADCTGFWSSSEKSVKWGLEYKNLKSDLAIQEMSILITDSTNFNVRMELEYAHSLWFVKGLVDFGYFKTTTPLILNAIDCFIKHQAQIFDKLERVKKLRGPENNLVSDRDKSKSTVVYHMTFTQDYCGWSTYKDYCRYTLEADKVHLNANNYKMFDVQELASAPHQGEILFAAIRLTVLDLLFKVGLSTLLDLNFKAKVFNEEKATGNEEKSPALQIESEYFRVCLSPPVLLKIFELAGKMQSRLKRLEGLVIKKASSDEPDVKRSPVRFSSVHVLSYNFCIGWLFGSSHKDYPGLILGSERMFAVTRASLGKLTMMDGYMSVANGSTSSSFYCSASDRYNLNRASMPKIQLNYYVDAMKKLWITLKGDELDVSCMSNSTVVLERTVKSISEIKQYWERKNKKAAVEPMEITTSLETVDSEKRDFKFLEFSALQLSIHFAGAKVYIMRLQENDLNETPPSLSLRSPAILVIADYEHNTERERMHILKVEILMSRSDNTIYSTCVPVVVDFVDTFSEIFADDKQQTKHEESSKEANGVITTENRSTMGSDMGKMLKDIDFHFGIVIEEQRISLSCEPVAKVAAVVEFEGASVLACSGLEESESLYITGNLSSISASLQHIYSNERSGSFQIKEMIFSNFLLFKPSLEIISSASFLNIHGFIRMKQYQDVDLFKDIWYPKKYRNPGARTMTTQKQSHSQPQQGESNPGFTLPAAFDIIFSNISLEIDFGPALGVMNLEVDKLWAVSRQNQNWFYEFKLGLQTLLLRCHGRLGGFLRLDGIFLDSAIEWKLDEESTLNIPLIHMAAGISRANVKAIFDDHNFAIGSVSGLRFDAYNRKNGVDVSKDHLFVILKYESINAYLTSLAASDCYDIYQTINRMIEEKRTSYKEILKDSVNDEFIQSSTRSLLSRIAKNLEAKIDVSAGLTLIHVYPHSFYDSKVLIIELDRSNANFTQSEYTLGVSNQIELQLNNVRAAFANTAGGSMEEIQSFDVDTFRDYSMRAKGGQILQFPRFMISMRTYQKYDTTLVEYLFQSSFGGMVDVRWNLGSVNCVREMYAAHKRALLSRTETKPNKVSPFREDFTVNTTDNDVSAIDSATDAGDLQKMLDARQVAHNDIDVDIQETMEKVTNLSRFTYKALAPPIIETPKLKDLGSATPPLEWFGLHRNKFPDATHQLAIVGLQKFIHEIELEYSKKLGKA